jgi:hypothetical protein
MTMLKKTISYTDYNDENAVDTFYFNLSKAELSENLDLIESFEGLQKMFEEQHDLSVPEIEIIFAFVKRLMRMSYGIRTMDGKGFAKSDEIWTSFTQTAAYSALLFSLFENPQEANDFMIGIFPKDLIDSAQKQIDKPVATVSPIRDVELPPEPKEEKPKGPKKPQDMSREELIAAMREKIEKNSKE